MLCGGDGILGGRPARLIRLTPAGASVLRGAITGDATELSPAGERLLERLTDTGLIHPLSYPIDGAGLEVTVAIPARNEAANIGRLVEALVPRVAEVIVVDDGSRDETARLAARAGAKVIIHGSARGPGAARNTALGAASTDLLAFIDADCLPPPDDWLDRLVPHLEQPGRVLVAPRIIGSGPDTTAGSSAAAIAAHERSACPLDMGDRPSPVGIGRVVSFVPSAAMLARRSALRKIGGFDESLRFGEDVDLVWRLNSAGGHCRYEPSVVIEHRSRTGLRAFARQRFEYGRSAAALDRRHPGAVAPVQGGRSATAATLALPVAGPLPLAFVTMRDTRKMVISSASLSPRQAFGIAIDGSLESARGLSRVLAREWLPITLAAACSKRLRRVALLGLLGFLADQSFRGTRKLPGSLALGLLDRLSYAAGLWSAAVAERNTRPIRPGRRPDPERSPERSNSERS